MTGVHHEFGKRGKQLGGSSQAPVVRPPEDVADTAGLADGERPEAGRGLVSGPMKHVLHWLLLAVVPVALAMLAVNRKWILSAYSPNGPKPEGMPEFEPLESLVNSFSHTVPWVIAIAAWGMLDHALSRHGYWTTFPFGVGLFAAYVISLDMVSSGQGPASLMLLILLPIAVAIYVAGRLLASLWRALA